MQLDTYLHFNGNCDEAFKFYEKVLGAKIEMRSTYGESPAGAQSPAMKDKIIHARIRIGDTLVMGSDTPPERSSRPQGFSMSLRTPDAASADKLFAALGDGGQVHAPIVETFFAHRFGMLADKFGVPWMVLCEKTP